MTIRFAAARRWDSCVGHVLGLAKIRRAANDNTRTADDDPTGWLGLELSVAVIWAVVALAGIFTPVLVTGSDPTRIPLAALAAPVAGMVATGFVALHAATRRAVEPR